MASEEQVAQLRAAAVPRPAPCRPVLSQFADAASLRGDLGAVALHRPAGDDRPRASSCRRPLELVLAASLLMVVVGIPLGVLGRPLPQPLAGSRGAPRRAARRGRRRASSGRSSSSWLFSYAFDLMPVIGRLSERSSRRRASPASSSSTPPLPATGGVQGRRVAPGAAGRRAGAVGHRPGGAAHARQHRRRPTAATTSSLRAPTASRTARSPGSTRCGRR